MRSAFYLLAIVLIGAVMMPDGFAQEAARGARDDKASDFFAERSSSRPAPGEDVAPGEPKPDLQPPLQGNDGKASKAEATPNPLAATAKDVNASRPDAKTSDGIDTHISVQPRRLGVKPKTVGQPKAQIETSAARNLHQRMLSNSGASNRTTRNAIGVALHNREDRERLDSEHLEAVVPHGPPAGTMGVGSARGNFAKVEGRIAHPIPNATVGASNRGTIDGTSLLGRRLGPSSIGGPAKAIAGIDGTTIRPTH